MVGLLVWVLLRRRRRPLDVIHDIQRLEQETVQKESELMKTIQAARQMEQSIESQVQHQQELSESASQRVGGMASQPSAETGADFLHNDKRQPPPV